MFQRSSPLSLSLVVMLVASCLSTCYARSTVNPVGLLCDVLGPILEIQAPILDALDPNLVSDVSLICERLEKIPMSLDEN